MVSSVHPFSPPTVLAFSLFILATTAGQIKLSDQNKCLEATTDAGHYSPATLQLHIAPCRPSTDLLFGRQLWREHATIYQISHARDSKCLHIAHADVGDISQDDNFASDKVVASACRYTSRDPHPTSAISMVKSWMSTLSNKGQFAEGFQRLVFTSGTGSGNILWRGQSRVLPSDPSARYCVEAESLETGAGVVLAHCEDGNETQAWTYIAEKGEKRDTDSALDFRRSAKMRIR
jgi:hypothetical protein